VEKITPLRKGRGVILKVVMARRGFKNEAPAPFSRGSELKHDKRFIPWKRLFVLQGGITLFVGADAVNIFNIINKDFTVTHFAAIIVFANVRYLLK
jgi:hypothetical protein